MSTFHFIESLKLNEKEQRVFNCGFVGLSEIDTIKLMEITEDEFRTHYRHYYNLGDSFCKFETLQKIHSKSDESIESLREYVQFRNMDIGSIGSIGSANTKNDGTEPTNTSDLINKLKNAKQSNHGNHANHDTDKTEV